jgi:hypothetical protein
MDVRAQNADAGIGFEQRDGALFEPAQRGLTVGHGARRIAEACLAPRQHALGVRGTRRRARVRADPRRTSEHAGGVRELARHPQTMTELREIRAVQCGLAERLDERHVALDELAILGLPVREVEDRELLEHEHGAAREVRGCRLLRFQQRERGTEEIVGRFERVAGDRAPVRDFEMG